MRLPFLRQMELWCGDRTAVVDLDVGFKRLNMCFRKQLTKYLFKNVDLFFWVLFTGSLKIF